jgi:hypothetical protein
MTTRRNNTSKGSHNPLSFFPEKQQKLLVETIQEIYRSNFKDPSNPPTPQEIYSNYRKPKLRDYYKPEAFDYSNPQTLYGSYWEEYIEWAALHNTPKNQAGTKRRDTSRERRKPAKELRKILGRTPTANDLRTAFPSLTKIDGELADAIDRDLQSLLEA